ncbi:MAG: glutamate--tRNA ligase [Candidatus Marinimicrobia bacterium]|nr:glutamate--tRNA ligase [Candidatus Neomarinimicrobiota bacterium]|tara:strand:+ start:110443 stop:111813 length:1371 start_codon:yes stop_codon:yes gene_type:complete
MEIRTRFAPSPTGFLHVGGLRTALYNYIFSKKNNGVFVLRIEDTDQNRLVENAIEQLIKSIRSFNLNFDEGPDINQKYGPYIQSERLNIYKTHYIDLIKKNKAYICIVKGNELIPEYNLDKAFNLMQKNQYVVKLKIPKNRLLSTFDELRGKIEFDLDLIEDPIIIKSDGYPTYHFANVIDDYLMKITHVIRGEEWLPSLPKHILLYECFGWKPPKFIHLPLLLNPDKSKLSKRQGDVNVDDFLKKGYLKEAIINFIALLGWHPSDDVEIFSYKSLLKNFSIKKIQKSGAIFDIKKLNWMNSVYIKELELKNFIELSEKFYSHLNYNFENKNKFFKVFEFIQNRIDRLDQIPDFLYPFYVDFTINDEQLLSIINSDISQKIIRYWNMNLIENHDIDEHFVKELIKDTGDKFDVKGKTIFYPLRIVLFGKKDGPDLFTLISILGIEKTKRRLMSILR